MSHWREEYFLALGVRDAREQANAALYDAYTRLADRTSQVHPHSHSPTPTTPAAPPSQQQQQQDQEVLLTAARADLSSAQRSRTELLEKLTRTNAELEKLRKKTQTDTRRIETLLAERTQLQTRVRDRDEELRGKAKLLDDVQAELVSINLQFNMADQRAQKLEVENKELVDRWMAKMGSEAEAMNRASKFS
ncbi:hypothetical protein AJ79_08352 [Helicocarpus griseus UAMH5409]|uniref:Autophagy-related protein 16 domain-containing protein n=1 Tax=Helicocarpus griseus UAMH5409 TaxID=1447875 RepID=A0A2B7WU37_9EURO|nr:hypothetical protein AJ79_08352 [Helicocarpus griseus UAMH5409]